MSITAYKKVRRMAWQDYLNSDEKETLRVALVLKLNSKVEFDRVRKRLKARAESRIRQERKTTISKEQGDA